MVFVIVVVLVIGLPLAFAIRWDRRQKRRGNTVRAARDMSFAAYHNRKNAKRGYRHAGQQALGQAERRMKR